MTANQINYWNYVENSRHNKATEQEQKRSNLAQEGERSRSNQENEAILREKNAIAKFQNIINARYNDRYLSETQRSNMAREQYNQQMADISAANIDLGYANMRNSYAIAGLNYGVGMANVGATYANIAEQQRANIARETELNRSNLVNEAVKWKSAGTEMFKAQTQRQEQQLNLAKWSDPVVRAQRQADYFHTIAQTSATNSQSSLNKSTEKLNSAKSFQSYTQGAKNISDLVGNATKVIINGAGALLGGK